MSGQCKAAVSSLSAAGRHIVPVRQTGRRFQALYQKIGDILLSCSSQKGVQLNQNFFSFVFAKEREKR
jgi:hypothetical protein